MKRFLWKIIFCTVPVLLSIAIVANAFHKYNNGEGGFKLGVDLAGGTDLIYGVDMDKFGEGADREKRLQSYSPQELAASLKRRIDPADLYNVTIRPVGNDRVEIILPTGGEHQSRAEDKVWQDLLGKIAQQWKPKEYKVPVGRTIELIARINEQYPELPIYKPETAQEGQKPPVADFIKANYNEDTVKGNPQKQEAAWKQLLDKSAKEYPPRTYAVTRGRTPTLVNKVREQYPDVTPQQVESFIEENYTASKERRHFTSEQVQEVKELISRVGSLEFRIVANSNDDKDAIEEAKRWFGEVQKDPKRKAELERLAIAGKAPPAPVNPDGDPTFPVLNDKDKTTDLPVRHSYTWVELGKAERQYLRLANSFAGDSWWKEVAAAREKGDVISIPQNFMQGSPLLYSRSADLNPRLPEKEKNKKYEYFVLTRDPVKGREVTGQYLTRAFETQGNNLKLQVGFEFNQKGGELFGELTSINKPEGTSETAFRRNLAVVLDGKIESAARINSVITTSGVIEGNFQKEDVDRLVKIFRAGALPASLKSQPVSESTIGATLGEATIRAGTYSVIVAFVAVLGFMLVYYRFAGFVACVALLANLLLTVAFMVVVNATFTLPGLAGLVLMLGMAVDANVLIYERLREERDRGASLPLAIRNGYDRAFPTIIDTHLSSIFTAIVLYAVGNDQLKGFGISLTVGLIISLFTSLYMTRLMFDVWQFKGWLKKLSMFRLLSKPNFDFMAIRYYWFTATIVLTILGAGIFIYRLDRGGLNIDFTKGVAYGGKLTEFMDLSELRDKLSKSGLPDPSIEQTFLDDPDFSKGGKTKLFTVRTSEQDVQAVQEKISKALGNLLAKTDLQDFKIDPDNKRAILSFYDPATKQPG
ncbi:MAG TPA: protein translocase subunit SecD, partial [Gemmataceae bacterium]|nr:protein translocase subunit SecD [Gemmataceae bacterium]